MKDSYNQLMQDSSHISGGSLGYVDALYEDYLANPTSVPKEWQDYFASLPRVNGETQDVSHKAIREQFLLQARMPKMQAAATDVGGNKQAHVLQLINAYRTHGHLKANLDPLNLSERRAVPDLELSFHGLNSAELSSHFTSECALTAKQAKLAEIITALEKTYCNNLGFEFTHITDAEQTHWLYEYVESSKAQATFDADAQKEILQHLTASEGLERYLGTKYVGQKRFSIEGAESMIPMLKELINRAGSDGVKEIILGMAHRGRLNVLVNVLGKAPENLFGEFEGKYTTSKSGDVKYHMGYSSDIRTPGGDVHLALSFNPSHLEIIGPVVQGSVRSRQRRRNDLVEKQTVVPVVIHGDAAFAGQGVVMETFNFSQARGYGVGGTVHIVINNQVGFTTSNPLDARSTLYCTDVAKMVQAPIIHVNGDDPEACVYAMQLATDYRMRFKRDVVIDLVCYRRHGHNEADEPSITQPLMYQVVKKIKTTRERYAKQLIQAGVLSESDAQDLVGAYRDALDKGEPVVETITEEVKDSYPVDWSVFVGKSWREQVNTGVNAKTLKTLGECLTTFPEGFSLHPVVKKIIDDRKKMTAGEAPINWGYAENMAYATLAAQGYPVRLSGQDCGRGTFAHRHAQFYDAKTGENYYPLQHVAENQGAFLVIDSVLSEEAVLAFEYGYAASEPNALVIWEAQFGDFANGAQVVFDQFISSGEQKWGRYCGLTMLLPHGYEGQGPEHSSARLERYLQLCAQNNMQVVTPTTPAQIFHLLRRQVIRPYRKPLIIMSPKSLLRHKQAVSALDDLAKGQFELIIPETEKQAVEKVRRVVLCGGKVYYELMQQRTENKQNDIAIIRIEQLYPFPEAELTAELAKYAHVADIIWCQEEPKNQGAWYCSGHHMQACLAKGQSLRYVGRDALASPAAGSTKVHKELQTKLINEALEG